MYILKKKCIISTVTKITMNYTFIIDINHIWQPATIDESLGP